MFKLTESKLCITLYPIVLFIDQERVVLKAYTIPCQAQNLSLPQTGKSSHKKNKFTDLGRAPSHKLASKPPSRKKHEQASCPG